MGTLPPRVILQPDEANCCALLASFALIRAPCRDPYWLIAKKPTDGAPKQLEAYALKAESTSRSAPRTAPDHRATPA